MIFHSSTKRRIAALTAERDTANARAAEMEARALALQSELESRKAREGDRKIIRYCGRTLVVHGKPGDPYFDGAGAGAEDDFLAFLLREPSQGTALDVGANIGLTSSVLSSAFASVHSFEPGAKAFAFLERTLEANGCRNVTLTNAAIGDAEGEILFFDNDISHSASHVITDTTLHQTGGYPVTLTTVDAYVKRASLNEVAFIKMDIEGHEMAALKGAQTTISDMKPAALVEFNPFTLLAFGNTNPREFLEFFRSLFPHVYRWRDGGPAEIANEGHVITFLHEVLVSEGCVADLYGTFRRL